METPSSSIRELARGLLVLEVASSQSNNERVHEAVRVCEKLRISLTRFAGADGFASLLRRSLALALADVPSLGRITINPHGSMEGLESLGDEASDAGVAIIAHLLGLLVTFIGEPLTMRMVRDAWPNASLEK